MTINNPVLEAWFEKALMLKPGGELFIACEDRKDRAKTIKGLDSILHKYVSVEPIIASQLVFRETFRDKGHWVRVLRKPNDPSILWQKNLDGTVSKVNVGINFRLKRQIELMERDGWTKDKIREHLIEEKDEIETYLKEK